MSDQNLTPEVATQVNATYTAMLNNFRKITSWLKHGTASEHKLPDVVLNFLTKVDGIEQTQAEQVGKLDTLATIVDGYEATIRKLEDANTLLVNALEEVYNVLREQSELIDTLTTKLEDLANTAPADTPADTPKKRTKKAPAEVQAEPIATQAPAEVQAEPIATQAPAEVQAEPIATQAPADTPKDKVQVTAEAVNAGDVSPEGFTQIDNIINGLFASVSAPQAPSVSDLDEL